MKTEVVTADEMDRLVAMLQQEEVIAFPTETVYGLGILYDSAAAMAKLKWAKKRPETKPFTLMVADVAEIEKFAHTKKRDWQIMRALMPGPLTVILRRREEIDERLTNGFPTIGIRCPADPFVRELIQKAGKPLLVPSANLSGEPAARSSDEVLAQLDGRIAMVVQGQCGSAVASTIVDLTGEEIRILRQGEITMTQIKEVIHESSNGM